MKKKLFLFATLSLFTLTSCSIDFKFTDTPDGSEFEGSYGSSSLSEPDVIAPNVSIPEHLNKYEIVFKANSITTQPNFTDSNSLYDAITIFDYDKVIAGINSFNSVAYGPKCLVIKELSIQIDNNFNFSYVSINATPFYVRNLDYETGNYKFFVESGYLGLNEFGYVKLNETHSDQLMDDTYCNFETNSKKLTIKAFDERVFINSISFYY